MRSVSWLSWSSAAWRSTCSSARQRPSGSCCLDERSCSSTTCACPHMTACWMAFCISSQSERIACMITASNSLFAPLTSSEVQKKFSCGRRFAPPGAFPSRTISIKTFWYSRTLSWLPQRAPSCSLPGNSLKCQSRERCSAAPPLSASATTGCVRRIASRTIFSVTSPPLTTSRTRGVSRLPCAPLRARREHNASSTAARTATSAPQPEPSPPSTSRKCV
eukprot:327329-Prymnesium_polylepis.1